MREIKFRGKKINGTDWLYYDLYEECTSEGVPSEFQQYIIDKNTISQFTNKKDSKGIEIYEGDIIEFDRREWGGDDNIHVVQWDIHNAEWCCGGGSTSDMQWRTVIGNIYENPELLKI